PSADYSLIGKVSESPKAVSAFDKNFDMQIAWHKDQVTFTQRIKLNKPETAVKGSLEFMVCNDEQCLPPAEVEFSIPVKINFSEKQLVQDAKDEPLQLAAVDDNTKAPVETAAINPMKTDTAGNISKVN